MRKGLLTLLASLLSLALWAQAPVGNVTIKGMVVDSATNKPMDFVTVALQDAATKTPVKSGLTKADGSFELMAPAGKSYQLVLAFVGYANKLVPVSGGGAVIDLGKLTFSSSSKQLNEVQVTGVKPVMKQEVDRISYDVQADPESKSMSALDMMRKVPLISVDANDNIQLRGSGNYKILLNGKESALMAKSPADILKAMPGTNIVKIEVITTPPAKYDAEGLAGIINIITSKKTDEGYNGSINQNFNTVFGYRTNLNATVKQGKFGFNGYVGVGKRPDRATDFYNESVFTSPASSLIQTGNRTNGNKNTYTSTELSFEADSLNLITGSFNYYKGNGTQGSAQFTQARNTDDELFQAYNTYNNGYGDYKGSDLGLNYQLGFKKNREQLLTASYKYSYSRNNQFNDVTSDRGMGYNVNDFRQYNDAGSKEYTTQLDYIHPLKKITVEAGGKIIARNSFSNFHNDTLAAPNQYITKQSQVNNFTYNQDVYSLYNSYLLKFTKWTLKAGARYERTNIGANFSSQTAADFKQNFTNVIPSVSIQRSLKSSSLTFGFTQRIQRPRITQLNPFIDSSNNKYITVGNPGLRPAINNNFELGYSSFAKGSVNLSASYAFANNTIQNLVSISNGITTTGYANVGKNKTLGLDLNANYPITKKLNVNVNAEVLKIWLKGTYNGEFYTNSGYQGHIFSYSSYKFDNGFRIGLNLNFDSRYVLLQGTDNYFVGGGINIGQEFFNKKLGIGVSANNPFAKMYKLDFTTKTIDVRTLTYNYIYYRSFNISVNYKFGRLNAEIKKNKRGINVDDAGSGSRN